MRREVSGERGKYCRTLETLAVDDGRTAFIVLLFGDPHLLEGGEGGQDGATDPDRVLALRRSDDLDLHRGWGEGGDFLLHAIRDARIHGGTAGLVNLVSRMWTQKKNGNEHTMTMLP